MPSSAGSVVPVGSTSRIASSRPCCITAVTTTPRHSTNARNGTLAAPAIPVSVLRRRLRPRTPSTTAPASAAQAGDSPRSDVPANPASVEPEYDEHEYRHVGRWRRLGGFVRVRELAPEEQPKQEVFGRDRQEPWRRHDGAEVREGEAGGAEGQQVGQVRHRQQQRRGVGQVRGGVGVRPRRDAQRSRRRQHHRRQQHDGRVQAQDRRRGGRDDEHRAEQPAGLTPAAAGHRHARGVKEALVVAELRQHQDRGQEADDGQQSLHLGQRVVGRDHARGDQQACGGHRGDGFRPSAGAEHRERQHHGQRGERERQLHGSARCHSVGR